MNLSDPAAERAVLAGVCRYGYDGFIDVDDLVKPDTFTIDSNEYLYTCIRHIFNQDSKAGIDLSSILSAASELNLDRILSTPNEIKHLKGIFAMPIKQENVRRLAGKIRKLEMARNYHNECRAVMEDLEKLTGDETPDKIVSMVEDRIFTVGASLAGGNTHEIVKMGQDGKEYLDYLFNNPREYMGIPTGFPFFDEWMGGGLRRAGMYVVGARAKIGKTSVGDAAAISITAKLNTPVLNIDTEMTREQHLARIYANMTGIEIKRIEKAQLTSAEKERVYEAASRLEQQPYHYLCAKGLSFDEVLSYTRRWVGRHVGYGENGRTNDCMLIYDYLKLLSSEQISHNINETQAMGFMITKLNDFIGRYDIPCLTFVQLNRDGIDRESTDVIALSDRVSWFCAGLAIFKEKAQEEIIEDGGPKAGNRKMVQLLARFGEPPDYGNYICYDFNQGINRISELNTKFNLKGASGNKKGFESKHDTGDNEIPF